MLRILSIAGIRAGGTVGIALLMLLLVGRGSPRGVDLIMRREWGVFTPPASILLRLESRGERSVVFFLRRYRRRAVMIGRLGSGIRAKRVRVGRRRCFPLRNVGGGVDVVPAGYQLLESCQAPIELFAQAHKAK